MRVGAHSPNVEAYVLAESLDHVAEVHAGKILSTMKEEMVRGIHTSLTQRLDKGARGARRIALIGQDVSYHLGPPASNGSIFEPLFGPLLPCLDKRDISVARKNKNNDD